MAGADHVVAGSTAAGAAGSGIAASGIPGLAAGTGPGWYAMRPPASGASAIRVFRRAA